MVRAYRPGAAASYQLRNAAARFAEETRRRAAPGLTGSEGKDAFNWARSSPRSEGATGCGGDGCLADLTPGIACEPLPAAGLTCSPAAIRIGAATRDGPSSRWASASPGSPHRNRLVVEHRVVRLLVDRCAFRVPRTPLVPESGFEVRQMVPGRCDPWASSSAVSRIPGWRNGSVGVILAEQHTAIGEAEEKDRGVSASHHTWRHGHSL
jgi:hypothetical protein